MAIGYLNNVNLNKNELQNARIQNLASAPSSPVLGQIYYNTGDNNLYVWDGAWVDLTVQGGGISYGTPSATINAGDSAVAGTSSNVLREDAQFAVATAAAVSISNANAEGTSTSLARADHTHAYGAASIPTSALATGVTLNSIAAANATSAAVAMNGQKITGLGDPTAAQDGATKNYVDGLIQGLAWKDSVRAATTVNGALATAYENGDAIDGITLATGDRILLKNQTTQTENGIYTVNASGAPTRATDADTANELENAAVMVEEGTQAGTAWVQTTVNFTLGTNNVVFTQFGAGQAYIAGNGLTLTANTFDVVGTTNRISVAADSIDISTSYVGQTSITTLGTITTGTWTGTTIAVGNGGTGQTTAKAARETGLGGAGYYSSATHGAGTSISITQATHGLRSTRGLLVQVQNEADGVVEYADVAVASNGDVTVTFAASQTANTKRVTIIG